LKFWKKNLFVRAPRDLFLNPSFLIIGSQKCGTTSLYNYLAQHPNIIAAAKKEIHFFDCNYDKGYRWYKSHFCETNKHRDKKNVIAGEATPYYIFHPHAPTRVKKTLPGVKLIVMLRNPVERAFSHYKHHVKYKVEPLSFIAAIKAESERLAGELNKMIQNENYQSYNLQMFSYLHRGVYVDQLKRWFAYFSKEQFLILKSEDFFAEPENNFAKTLRFLGLPEYKLMHYKKFNPSQAFSMDNSTREYLINYFRPYNENLYELLGLDFGW
jgi:hypothetical protein